MITSHLDALIRKKAAADNRRLSIRRVAKETKLAINTIQRLKEITPNIESIHFSTLEKLCCYFGVGIGELIEYKTD